MGQKAQEVKLLNAALRQKDEALEARAAQCEQLQKTLEAQAVSLTEKEALIERQGNALSLPRPPSLLRRRRLKRGGNALRVSTAVKFSVLDFAETYLLLLLRATEEDVGGDRSEGGPPSSVRVRAAGLR